MSAALTRSEYASPPNEFVKATRLADPPSPAHVPPLVCQVPCNWPGTTDRDAMFEARDRAFGGLRFTEPLRLDPFGAGHTKAVTIVNNAIARAGKNVCQYKQFIRTPVLWFE